MLIGVINAVIGILLIKDIEEQFKPVAVKNDPYYEDTVIIINYYWVLVSADSDNLYKFLWLKQNTLNSIVSFLFFLQYASIWFLFELWMM